MWHYFFLHPGLFGHLGGGPAATSRTSVGPANMPFPDPVRFAMSPETVDDENKTSHAELLLFRRLVSVFKTSV